MLSVAVGVEQFVFTVSILLQSVSYYCCDPNARGASAQSFEPWQDATTEITRRAHASAECSRYVYNSVVLGAHSIHGESHIQHNANGEVATLHCDTCMLQLQLLPKWD